MEDATAELLIKKLDETNALLQELLIYLMVRDEVPYGTAGKVAKRGRPVVNAIGKAYKNSKHYQEAKRRRASDE